MKFDPAKWLKKSLLLDQRLLKFETRDDNRKRLYIKLADGPGFDEAIKKTFRLELDKIVGRGEMFMDSDSTIIALNSSGVDTATIDLVKNMARRIL